MSPARTLYSGKPASPKAQVPDGGHDRILLLLDALQSGRLRIVERPSQSGVFRPRMEVYDDPAASNIVATFELPGVKSDDLSIGVKEDALVIRGRRLCRHWQGENSNSSRRNLSLRGVLQENDADSDAGTEARASRRAEYTKLFPWRELRYGYFYRKIRLPQGVNNSSIDATLADGLLTVRFPRALPGPTIGTATSYMRTPSDHPVQPPDSGSQLGEGGGERSDLRAEFPRPMPPP